MSICVCMCVCVHFKYALRVVLPVTVACLLHICLSPYACLLHSIGKRDTAISLVVPWR